MSDRGFIRRMPKLVCNPRSRELFVSTGWPGPVSVQVYAAFWRIFFIAIIAAGCSAPQQEVDIPFELRFGEATFSCAEPVAGVTLTDLRFYVHDLRLLDENGSQQSLTLAADPLWQNSDVALLDFENGEQDCANGTPPVNHVVRGRVPAANYKGLAFHIGVPDHLNHADPLRAEPPLNYSYMHWHWRTGYKFLRAGIASADDGFWIHLGSARCERTASHVTHCRSGNRPSVSLPEWEPGTAVVIDLKELVRDIELDDGTPTDCSSGPAETACEPALAALGIDRASGAAVRGSSIFRAGER